MIKLEFFPPKVQKEERNPKKIKFKELITIKPKYIGLKETRGPEPTLAGIKSMTSATVETTLTN
jgi:hypothetical protein